MLIRVVEKVLHTKKSIPVIEGFQTHTQKKLFEWLISEKNTHFEKSRVVQFEQSFVLKKVSEFLYRISLFPCKKTRMVIILAASSLHHALEILTGEEKEQFKTKFIQSRA